MTTRSGILSRLVPRDVLFRKDECETRPKPFARDLGEGGDLSILVEALDADELYEVVDVGMAGNELALG